ncbi:hypothetical protein EDC04DRAFT_2776111 [Pisolithus marmoratus]|nr:hypothetical protein EDC04DRAFT_2776111 [Pisolithus marmoratus]
MLMGSSLRYQPAMHPFSLMLHFPLELALRLLQFSLILLLSFDWIFALHLYPRASALMDYCLPFTGYLAPLLLC